MDLCGERASAAEPGGQGGPALRRPGSAALTMRTLSLGSSSARPSSSSTTSQFSSPHLAQGEGSGPRRGQQRAAPAAPAAGQQRAPTPPGRDPGQGSQGGGVRQAQLPLGAPRSRGASTSGTYSLTKCCASSLVRKTLGPRVSADTRLTSRTQSPRLSASTLRGGDASVGTGTSAAPSWRARGPHHPPAGRKTPPNPLPAPAALSGQGGQTRREEPRGPGGTQPSSARRFRLRAWERRAPLLERKTAPAEGRGWKGSPIPVRFPPLSPVAQLPAGPRVAVAARFAAGVRGAAQVAVALRGVLGAVPAVRLLPAAPGQPRLVAHCKESDPLTPKPCLRTPSSLPGSPQPPQPSSEGTHLGCCGQRWLLVASGPWVGCWQGRGLARAGRCLRGAPRGDAGVPPGREARHGPPPRPRAGGCSAGLPRSRLGTGRGHQEPPGGPRPALGTRRSVRGQWRAAGTAAPGSAQTSTGQSGARMTQELLGQATGHKPASRIPVPAPSRGEEPHCQPQQSSGAPGKRGATRAVLLRAPREHPLREKPPPRETATRLGIPKPWCDPGQVPPGLGRRAAPSQGTHTG